MNKTSPLVLTKWLVRSTRGVLSPLLASALARILDQCGGIALFVVPSVIIANAFTPNKCGCAVATGASVAGLLALMSIIALVKAVMRYLEQYLGHLVAFKALELLRARAFRALSPQAPAIVARTHSGEMLARLTKDIDRIEVFFAHTFAPAISACVMPLLVTLLAFMLAPWQMGVALVVVFAVGLVIPWIGIETGHRGAQSELVERGALTAVLTDSLGGLAEIVGYGLEETSLDTVEQCGERVRKVSGSGASLAALRQAALEAWRMVSLLVVLGVGAWLYAGGGLSLGAWLAVAFSMLRCWEVLQTVGSFGVDLNVVFAAAGRVYRLANAGLELSSGSAEVASGPASLQFYDASFTYRERTGSPGHQGAVSGPGGEASAFAQLSTRGVCQINLEVKPGSWTTLVGVTGSGKTTLARLALRFFDANAGSVLLNGRDVREYRLSELRSAISLVSAEVTLFDLTVGENLRLAAPQASDAELWSALKFAQLDAEIGALGGLEYRVGERGERLSGGQRQRISLAQALLRPSRLLILDEYTAHLNPELARRIAQTLRGLKRRPTILEITHDLASVGWADWIAVMDLGRIVEQGTPAALLSGTNSVLRAMCGEATPPWQDRV